MRRYRPQATWKYGYPLVISVITACSLGPVDAPVPEPDAPLAPLPIPTTPVSTAFTVSGTVFDHTETGPRPRAGLLLRLRTATGFIEVESNSSGRFTFTNVSKGFVSIAPAPSSGYIAPCPSGTDPLSTNAVLDVHVAATSLLASTGTPATIPRGSISTSGVVFESTATGKRPVSGAIVELAVGSELQSTTVTSATGQYLLCPSVPDAGTDQEVRVQAVKDGFLAASRSAKLARDFTGVDLELIRR